MIRKPLRALLGATALLSLLSAAALSPARAQSPAQQGNPLQNFNIPPSLFFGFVGQTGAGIDPTHSSAMQLLQRNDVRNEIALDLKQQNALDELRTKSQQEFRTTLQENVKASVQAIQNAPQDQQQSQIQERMDQFATTIQTLQGDIDKRAEGILRPKQAARLRELDLRWRGPMALSDPKVAEVVKLTPEQSGKVGLAVKSFVDAQQKAMMQAMVPAIAPNGAGQDGGQSPQERAAAMQKKMYDVMHSREMDKTKADVEAKILDVLTPAQKTQWTGMLGAKFTFRKTEVP